MTNYNEVNTPKYSSNRYTVAFKTSYEQHSQLQDVATTTGMSIQGTCRLLMGLGLEAYAQQHNKKSFSPKQALYMEVNKARERQHTINLLAEIRGSLDEKIFIARCKSVGVDPSEVGEGPLRPDKTARCKAFLRVLFYDRPAGLPVNEVITFSQGEGFGENTTRTAAKEIGLEQAWETTDGKRVSKWRPTND